VRAMKNFFYPIVELFWKDHYSLGDEWYDEMKDQPVRILSAVGYLWKKMKTTTTLLVITILVASSFLLGLLSSKTV
jgi:hypothetical protein